MNRSFLLRLACVGLVLLGVLWLAQVLTQLDIGTLFVVVVVGGCVVGILAVKFILPRVADAVTAFLYSSGGVAGPEKSTQASAKIAQGDYAGAVVEYERLLAINPEDTLAIWEIARLRAEKLAEPKLAVSFLETQITNRTWSQDKGAYLLFRLAELHQDTLNDFDGALAVLERVMAQFPNTCHSANAHHRVNEIHQAQFKALTHQRQPEVKDA